MLQTNWQFGSLGIYNYRKPGYLEAYFANIREGDAVPGDILEAGVFREDSLLATGLLFKEIGSSKTVYGFDTYCGIPPAVDRIDQLARFNEFYSSGEISEDHYRDVQQNISWRSHLRNTTLTPLNISWAFR